MAAEQTLALPTLALKEWGAVAHALLDGRQTVLLRKGGIHERRFAAAPDDSAFVLFPTVAHSDAERVRGEHAELLAAGEADVSDDVVLLRCGLRLVATIEVRRPEGMADIAGLHIWTEESVRSERLSFRPRQPLQVLVVRCIALPEPVRIERVEAYAGCRSWLELPPVWDGEEGKQVHDDARLAADAARVRAAVG